MAEDSLKDMENLFTDHCIHDSVGASYLADAENLFTDDLSNDGVGASHLKTAQSVSFSEMCAYTVELPISEHWRPEVKMAKKAEIRNLQDYKTFIKVKD